MFYPLALFQESISTCRFAQRVAMIKNEAVLNEELDPSLVRLNVCPFHLCFVLAHHFRSCIHLIFMFRLFVKKLIRNLEYETGKEIGHG